MLIFIKIVIWIAIIIIGYILNSLVLEDSACMLYVVLSHYSRKTISIASIECSMYGLMAIPFLLFVCSILLFLMGLWILFTLWLQNRRK